MASRVKYQAVHLEGWHAVIVLTHAVSKPHCHGSIHSVQKRYCAESLGKNNDKADIAEITNISRFMENHYKKYNSIDTNVCL